MGETTHKPTYHADSVREIQRQAKLRIEQQRKEQEAQEAFEREYMSEFSDCKLGNPVNPAFLN